MDGAILIVDDQQSNIRVARLQQRQSSQRRVVTFPARYLPDDAQQSRVRAAAEVLSNCSSSVLVWGVAPELDRVVETTAANALEPAAIRAFDVVAVGLVPNTNETVVSQVMRTSLVLLLKAADCADVAETETGV